MEAVIKGVNELVGFKSYNYKDKNGNAMYGMTILNDNVPETVAISENVYDTIKGLKMGTKVEIILKKDYKGYGVIAVKAI